MRLLLDEHIDRTVAERLRSEGFDVVAVTERPDLIEAGDRELLEQAAADRRAIVTYDVADFRIAARERVSDELIHSGVILLNPRRFPQGKRHIGGMVAALAALLEELRADDALIDRERWL
ncbi:MAG: DUF5615 family PIN-like protein [Chloroflexota bacterium]|nr:DUF5615 family PIN-like protein [Chloroflexota bacterium]